MGGEEEWGKRCMIMTVMRRMRFFWFGFGVYILFFLERASGSQHEMRGVGKERAWIWERYMNI